MQTLSSHPADPSFSPEKRLIRKMAPAESVPENTADVTENGKEKKKKNGGEAQEKATKQVEKETAQTNGEVADLIPDARGEITNEGPNYVQLPSLRKAVTDVRNAALTILGVALTPVGLAGLAAGGTARYLASKRTDKPLSIGRAAHDTFIKAPKSGLASVARTLLFPLHWPAAAGLNALKFTGNRLYRLLDLTILEPYREITHKLARGKEAELGEGERKGLHPITAGYAAGKWLVWDTPRKIVGGFLKNLAAHPGPTLIGTAIGVPLAWGVLHNISGVYDGISTFGSLLLKILEGLAGKVG